MQYSHSKEKAVEHSNAALERISSEGLAPVPQNFELWYVYYSSVNPDVVRAIDILIANKQKITDEKCEELHQRFLSNSKDDEKVREAGGRVQDAIKDVTGRVSGIKSAAKEYNKALESATDRLSKVSDPSAVQETLNEVLDSTQGMIQHNIQLEEELARSSAVMQELQRDLELVRKQALTDGLTNLANRKAFDDEIMRIKQACDKEKTTFTLVLLDIDHFKNFNDTYGHQVGDQVLRLVAKTLFDGVKGRDIAARYGGEEFALVLPETNLTGGMKVADSLRKIIQGKELINRNSGDVLGRITVSGGVAEYVSGEKIEDLVERADGALYTSKNNGRNQISTAAVPRQK